MQNIWNNSWHLYKSNFHWLKLHFFSDTSILTKSDLLKVLFISFYMWGSLPLPISLETAEKNRCGSELFTTNPFCCQIPYLAVSFSLKYILTYFLKMVKEQSGSTKAGLYQYQSHTHTQTHTLQTRPLQRSPGYAIIYTMPRPVSSRVHVTGFAHQLIPGH